MVSSRGQLRAASELCKSWWDQWSNGYVVKENLWWGSVGSCIGKSDLSKLRLGLAKPLQARKTNPSLETDQSWSEENLSHAGNVAPSWLVVLFRGLHCIGSQHWSLVGKQGRGSQISLGEGQGSILDSCAQAPWALFLAYGGCCLFCSGSSQMASVYDGTISHFVPIPTSPSLWPLPQISFSPLFQLPSFQTPD